MYILLKCSIYIINNLIKSMLKCTSFSQEKDYGIWLWWTAADPWTRNMIFPRVKVMQCKVFVLVCFAVFSRHYWTHLASHTAKHLLAACDSGKVICLHGSAEKQDGVEDIHEKNIINSQFISPQATNYHYRLVQIPRHPYLQHISQTTSSERHQLYFPRQLRKIQSKSAPSTRFLCCHCGEGQKVQRLRVYTRSVFVRNLICSDFF